MFNNGSWWIDAEPFCAGFLSLRQGHYSSNLARLGSFPQITNTLISLLIQTGSSFNNSAQRHKALKHSVTYKWWWEMAHRCCFQPLNPFLHYGCSIAPCFSLHYISDSQQSCWIKATLHQCRHTYVILAWKQLISQTQLLLLTCVVYIHYDSIRCFICFIMSEMFVQSVNIK